VNVGDNPDDEAGGQRILRNPPIMGIRQPAMQPSEKNPAI